jgi:general secretion pathway protein M
LEDQGGGEVILRLSPRLSRVLAVSLAAGVALIVAVTVVMPLFFSGSEQAEQLVLLRRQVQIMEGMISAAPQYEAVMKRLAANPQIQSFVFATPQASLAIAQLQSQVNQLIAKAGGNVTTSQALPEAAAKALTKISVSAAFEGDIKAVTAVFHDLDSARPLLFVTKLSIRDPDGEWAAPSAATSPNKLQVEIVVTSYMRKT